MPGLAIAKAGGARRVVMSDYVQECLDAMQASAAMNGLQPQRNTGEEQDVGALVMVERLDWRDVHAGGPSRRRCWPTSCWSAVAD